MCREFEGSSPLYSRLIPSTVLEESCQGTTTRRYPDRGGCPSRLGTVAGTLSGRDRCVGVLSETLLYTGRVSGRESGPETKGNLQFKSPGSTSLSRVQVTVILQNNCSTCLGYYLSIFRPIQVSDVGPLYGERCLILSFLNRGESWRR